MIEKKVVIEIERRGLVSREEVMRMIKENNQ